DPDGATEAAAKASPPLTAAAPARARAAAVLALALGFGTLVVLGAVQLTLGTSEVSAQDLLGAVLSGEDPRALAIAVDSRLPRLVGGL
ncbi:hypothetical protein NL334_27175, partial [Klebsiella pneumoniae]|nr:hypothetical protein [Klebsiella pneumoniae]